MLFFVFGGSYAQTCTNGFSLMNNKCWKLFPGSLSHNDAVRGCSSIGASLYSAKNAIDNRAMYTFLTNQRIDHIWMGLYCFGIDKSQCYWDDDTGSAASFGNFAPGFPNMGFGKCVYYSYPGGQWATGDCGQKMPYVCELPPTMPDSCLYNYNNHCYFPMPYSSPAEAIATCDQLCSTLASVHSSLENRYIASISPKDITMLGGVVSPGSLVWMDGSQTDYNNDDIYPVDYSKGPFLSMNPETGDFFANDGSKNKAFICKRPAGAPCDNSKPANVTYPRFTSNSRCLNPDLIMAPAIISSPNYPNDYPANVLCSWGISAQSGGHRLRMTFNAFDTEKDDDLVRIYDGDSDKAPLIATYSGGPFKPFTVTTSGPSIYVSFYSDKYYTFSGFTSFVVPVF